MKKRVFGVALAVVFAGIVWASGPKVPPPSNHAALGWWVTLIPCHPSGFAELFRDGCMHPFPQPFPPAPIPGPWPDETYEYFAW